MKSKVNTQKVKAFFKKYMYYMIMGVCILAIGAMITVAAVVGTKDNNPDQTPGNLDQGTVTPPDDEVVTPPDDDDTPVDTDPDPIVFTMPVSGGTLVKDYTMDTLVWSTTLKQYQVHNGIDFGGEEGAKVLAVYDGVVLSVSYDALNCNVVTIDHGDGLVTSYSSLSEPAVTVGQIIKQGNELGTISTSATSEMSDGAHVHFSVTLNGAVVSPYDYFAEGDK